MALIAEVIGPSGAGKSTISQELNRHDGLLAGLTIWRLPIATLAIGAVASLPALIAFVVRAKRLRAADLKQIIRLNAFSRNVKKAASDGAENSGRALIFDEGIVFALAKLRADSSGIGLRPHDKWEKKTLDRWSCLLDAVVWIDADDEMLIRRVRERAKRHRMKHSTDAELREFLARYRRSYEEVIAEITARHSQIKVIRLSSNSQPADSLAGQIAQFIDSMPKPASNGGK